MRVAPLVRVADASDPGLQRPHNEDRCHADDQRGIFMVVDGIGGQAAGETAADIAIAKLRDRLERQTGRIEDRVREAIAIANDEIFRLASIRPEWRGMACVLTVAVRDNGDVVVGHVGDTRMYKIRKGRLQKITRDHSPVGEREDARELSEQEAMRHPRRNEVFRDVGSEPHHPDDPDFIDVQRVPFEPDAAILLCSDGLTDAVPSSTIGAVVETFAGHPRDVVRELIEAANEAGGKDNVTVVYVEGEQFAASQPRGGTGRAIAPPASTAYPSAAVPAQASRDSEAAPSLRPRGRWRQIALLILVLLVVAAALGARTDAGRGLLRRAMARNTEAPRSVVVVAPGESIQAALNAAGPGAAVVVEPGEYRERLTLRSGIRLESRVPRAAIIRLSSSASESEPAVVARDVTSAAFAGFRIVGDAATPMGIGVYVDHGDVTIADVEITGASGTAVEFAAGSSGALIGSDIVRNAGAALTIGAGSSPRISHDFFSGNATSEAAASWLVDESHGGARFDHNVVEGTPYAAAPDPAAGRRAAPPKTPAHPVRGGRKGRR
ncbi:MAG TPA: protein phosphatase 2C domain-containing protein [Vicinamibacterales bacterium]|nr:protein phosphatase 2C domain-containing protein [Vicinamibacterales bacterium]